MSNPMDSPRERMIREQQAEAEIFGPPGTTLTPEQEQALAEQGEALRRAWQADHEAALAEEITETAEEQLAALQETPFGPAAEQESPFTEQELAEIQAAEPPEILTLIELEKLLGELEASKQLPDAQERADDLLQGAVVVMGMNFGGDVQMVTLACLQAYREIKGLR